MRVYLIRHGSTAGNLEKRYVGTTDEPLTPEAVRELEKMRENRRKYRKDSENGSLMVFSSPLLRCLLTAQASVSAYQAAYRRRIEGMLLWRV